MVIPYVFNQILGIKPKNPHVASLLSQVSGFQDIGINLTQFNSFIEKRVGAQIKLKELKILQVIKLKCVPIRHELSNASYLQLQGVKEVL